MTIRELIKSLCEYSMDTHVRISTLPVSDQKNDVYQDIEEVCSAPYFGTPNTVFLKTEYELQPIEKEGREV